MQRNRVWPILKSVLARCFFPAALATCLATSAAAESAANDPRCTVEIDRWGIHLHDLTRDEVFGAAQDLIVIDPTLDGNPARAFSAGDIAAMKTGSDGQRRLVIAYLSIGQAEDYRAYWKPEWLHAPPDWLDRKDASFPDNYEVRYWDRNWQALVFGAEGAMLDDLIAKGFDGVMMDGVDAFETWSDRHGDAAHEMAEFVAALGVHARARDPGFLLLALNGENLLVDGLFAAAIDGVVKEDLFFGQGHLVRENPPEMVAWATARLALAQKRRLPVFVLEYIPPGAERARVGKRIDAAGYLGSFGVRSLADRSESHPAAEDAVRTFAAGAGCRSP